MQLVNWQKNPKLKNLVCHYFVTDGKHRYSTFLFYCLKYMYIFNAIEHIHKK